MSFRNQDFMSSIDLSIMGYVFMSYIMLIKTIDLDNRSEY